MNAPLRSPVIGDGDELADAREETWRNLQAVAHYCKCCQAHLQYADDTVALYDMRAAREYFIAAIREFEPVRNSIAERIGAMEGGER